MRTTNDTARLRPRRDGFTLVEVMVALAIVAIGLYAALTSVNQAAYNAYYIKQKAFASWVAQNKIAEIRTALAAPEIDTSNGESELGGSSWRWEATVLETPAQNVLRIEVGVAALDEPDNELVRLVAFMGLPIPATRADLSWEGGAPQ